MEEELYRVESTYFIAGFVVREGRVYTAAPILKRLRGQPVAQALRIAKQYGWEVKQVNHASKNANGYGDVGEVQEKRYPRRR